ncbi:OmpL47-type beta-barrel domain-containing protein [Candidatus Bipolaricaulota bacterium]
MGRKVAGAAMATFAVVLSVVLVGGQVGSGGFLWWGNRGPIYIYGNDGFTVENGVFSGSGTASDPYVIEGWRIDQPQADYGFYIDHTTAHFVIRDCVIEGTRMAGVYFNTVQNGRVEDTQIGLSDTAVYLLDSSFNIFERNVIAESKYGVVTAANSRDNIITENSFLDNGLNGYDPHRWNQWNLNCIGNYWSDYKGYDGDEDGIGDIPYYTLNDEYPLMSPPVQWTRVAPAGLTYSGNQMAPDGSLVVSSDTPISLSAMDPGSGLAEIQYSINRGPWIVYTGPVYLTGDDGPQKLTYYGIDRLGNVEQQRTVSFMLDNHPPITEIEIGQPKYEDARGIWVTSKSRISLNLVQASTYGVTQTFYRIDGRGWQRYGTPFVIMGADGPHQISFYSLNASGITEDLKTIIIIKDDAPPSTRGAQASAAGSEVQVQVGPATAPVIVEPAPPVEETPPVIEAPASTVDEPAPAVDEPAPAVDEPAGEAEPADDPT